MQQIGIVAFSFGLREGHEPTKPNQHLAENVARIWKHHNENCVIVAQWEVALALESLKVPIHYTVNRTTGVYLDSEGVMEAARQVFHQHGVISVIPVAHPFIHNIKCRRLVKASGFTLVEERITHIGFDKNSDQKYTRGPLPLLWYSVRQALWKHKGKPSS